MTPHLTWQSSALAWFIVALAMLAGAHALLSYARARQTTGRRWSRALVALRLLAIALPAIAAFQPTLGIEQSASRTRRVIVMMDSSLSMGVVDSSRSLPELVRFAEAVGKIDPALRDRPARRLLGRMNELSGAVALLRARDIELSQAKTAGRLDEPIQTRRRDQRDQTRALVDSLIRQARESPDTAFVEPKLNQIAESLDTSGLPQAPEKMIEGLTNDLRQREDQADEQLVRSNPEARATIESLKSNTRLDLAKPGAARVVRDLGSRAIPVFQQMQNALRPESLPQLSADQPQTPLLQALRRTIEQNSGRDLNAVVLFTDGRSTEARTSIPPVLSVAGVPVFSVLCAPADRVPDVRLARIEAPATALTGETIAVTVHLRSRGAEGRPAKITLSDGKQTQSRAIVLGASDDVVRFDIPAARAPSVELKAFAEPLNGESLTDNNSASATVGVVDQKIRVALLSGTAGWDTQYLRNILVRTPWIELQEQFLEPKDLCRFSVDLLARQDVIILAGVMPAALSAQQIDAIHRAVSEQSRSVLMLDVDPELLHQYSRQPLLAALLPYRIDGSPVWRQGPAEESTIRPSPTSQAAMLPLLKLDDAPDASMRRWLARPLMYRMLNLGQLKPQARALLVDRLSLAPLMVESVVGAGRSMTLAINETWRWRRQEGGDAHDRFWLQLVRHLTEPLYNVSDGRLSLGADLTRAPAGRTIELRARTPAEAREPATIAMRQGENVIETQPLVESLPGSGRWSARLTPQTPGEYEIELAQADRRIALRLSVLPGDETELADVSSNPGLLRRIAGATGGRMFSLDEVAQVAGAIHSPSDDRVDTIQYAIWCSPYLFCAIVACLGLEWGLRKQLGLV